MARLHWPHLQRCGARPWTLQRARPQPRMVAGFARFTAVPCQRSRGARLVHTWMGWAAPRHLPRPAPLPLYPSAAPQARGPCWPRMALTCALWRLRVLLQRLLVALLWGGPMGWGQLPLFPAPCLGWRLGPAALPLLQTRGTTGFASCRPAVPCPRLLAMAWPALPMEWVRQVALIPRGGSQCPLLAACL